MERIAPSHALAFVLGVAITAVVAITFSHDFTEAPHPERPLVPDSAAPPGPARPVLPEVPQPEPALMHPATTPDAPIATDQQIALAIAALPARYPIDDPALLKRVVRSTEIGLRQYRTLLSLTPDQANRLVDLIWQARARNFQSGGEIRAALARVKQESGHLIREADLAAVENEFDVYRRYDADLDRLLDEGPNRYRDFAIEVRNLLTEGQREILDEREQLLVK